jgi:hypothetical protein
MAVFVRRNPPPPAVGDYRRYRPYVREDFRECCAYCLLHEMLAAGVDNFELDHFKPKSDPRFSSLKADYYNIYYSCHVCNHYKGAAWPSEELMALGYRFIDSCTDVFSEHFAEDVSGTWTPLSKAGEYTAARLRLNRKHLVEIRGLLRDLATLHGQPPLDWNHPAREQLARILTSKPTR